VRAGYLPIRELSACNIAAEHQWLQHQRCHHVSHRCSVKSDVLLETSSILLDTLENVRVSFLLPLRQIVPVCYVGWLWIWKILKDLPDPPEGDKASLLRMGEFRSAVVGGFDERAHLIMNGSGALPFPLRAFAPRSDVAGLWLRGVMPRDPSNPCFTEHATLFDCQFTPPLRPLNR
jgi:hypothetical protein